MSTPSHILARYVPGWRQFTIAALVAAEHPDTDCSALASLADRAGGWSSPFTDKGDQYVGATLLWAAKAFCRQTSAVRRAQTAKLLIAAAEVFSDRLAQLEQPPATPLPPRPFRADIDG